MHANWPVKDELRAMPLAPPYLPVPNADQRRAVAEFYLRAEQWLAARQPLQAIALLQKCCLLDPADLVCRKALHAARRQLRPHLGLTTRVRLWWRKVRLQNAVQTEAWASVLQRAEDVLTLEREYSPAFLAMAKVFESLGLLEHAVWSLEQAMPAIPDAKNRITKELFRLYEKVGRFSQARALITPMANTERAPDAQADHMRDQIPQEPANAGLYLQIIRHFRQAGDLDAARDWAVRGLKATANAFALAVEQADLNLEPLRHDISLAKERVEQEPTNTELQAMLTRLDQELQAREIELCRLQADRQPGDPTKQLELGIRLLKARQFEAALEAYQRVRNDPKLAWQALVYSGYCYLNQNNWPRAAPLFEEALPLIPADAEATRKEVLFLLACHGAGTATWPKALQYGAELAKLDSSYRGIEEFLTDWRRKALASEA